MSDHYKCWQPASHNFNSNQLAFKSDDIRPRKLAQELLSEHDIFAMNSQEYRCDKLVNFQRHKAAHNKSEIVNFSAVVMLHTSQSCVH